MTLNVVDKVVIFCHLISCHLIYFQLTSSCYQLKIAFNINLVVDLCLFSPAISPDDHPNVADAGHNLFQNVTIK